ncbi:MAG: hypothetical protein IJ105_02250 [Bacilli bacterium]|nr:hypothetical protein [Bacilli bacterium]
MNEEIEVLDEDFTKSESTNNSKEIISLDRLFDNSNEEVIDAYEEDKKLEEIRQQKITKIQIGLIVFLIIFASLVYFFGYNFLEPFIKID